MLFMSDTNLIENILREKYGDLGVRVYTLIDGQRNTEQIMNTIGLQEPKLLEILEFMEARGIIKMRYPQQSHTITVTLPSALKERMQRYNVDWDKTVTKLISFYLDGLEKAKSGLKSKTKKSKKTKKKKAVNKKKPNAKPRTKKKSKKKSKKR